jgi:predicted Zn-dependent protease
VSHRCPDGGAETALARAKALRATCADIRVNRYRRESVATRERQVQNVSRSTSRGFGLRVLVDGAWNVEAVGVPRRVSPMLVPALKLAAFSFTSISDAIQTGRTSSQARS